MNQTRVSLISYLNSRPFLFGLLNAPVKEEIKLLLDIPSVTAAKLANRQADIGLIPVGALLRLPGWQLVSDLCIGAEGAVRTTILASEVPLEEIETVLMDYQSRSSVLLTRVLARYSWRMNFRWAGSSPGFEKKEIVGRTAGVVIGDRVFGVEKKYPYMYDLSLEWMKFSGLPFVFAVWAATETLPPEFLIRFNQALALGVDSIPEVEKTEQPHYPDIDIYDYFTRNISYALDDRKRQGMDLFLRLAGQLPEE